MKILLDMDEVIENMTHHWIETLNSIYGLSVKYEDVTDWDMTKAYPTLSRESIYNPLYLESFWSGVEFLPEAKQAILKLINDGHDVYILTSSHPDTVALKAKWLINHLPEIPWNRVIIARDKYMIDGDVLVDDGLHNLYKGKYKKIVFDKPWNRNVPSEYKDEIIRAYDWDEVVNIINML